jgi:hypothetical protein
VVTVQELRGEWGPRPEEFLEQYSVPFLVLQTERSLDAPVFDEAAATDDDDFVISPPPRVQTSTLSDTHDVILHGADSESKLSAIPLLKRRGANQFGMFVTLGRAANNDIILPSSDISKVHALFFKVGADWKVRDSNSRHGTFLGSLRLDPDEPAVLSPGAQMRFASVKAEVLWPEQILERLIAPD